MSALGYLVWLTHSENTRRDRLRARGDLPPTTPAYELLGHWVRHPWLTHRARVLAKADPGLGLYGSIAAAYKQHQQQRRRRAIAAVLHRKIRAAVDNDTAAIAVAVYDLDQIAHQLAAAADYDALTALVAADLQPDRLTGRPGGECVTPTPPGSTPFPVETGGGTTATTMPHTPDVTIGHNVSAAPARPPARARDLGAAETWPAAAISPPRAEAGTNPPPAASVVDRRETAAAVAYWHQRHPDMHPADIAARIGRSERTVRRHWPTTGHAKPSQRLSAAGGPE